VFNSLHQVTLNHPANLWGRPVIACGTNGGAQVIYADEANLKAGDIVDFYAYVYIPPGVTARAEVYNILSSNGSFGQGFFGGYSVNTGGYFMLSVSNCSLNSGFDSLRAYVTPTGAGNVVIISWGVFRKDASLTVSACETVLYAGLIPKNSNSPRMLLPRNYYALVGGTGAAVEESNIYFYQNTVESSDKSSWDIAANFGRQYSYNQGFYRVQLGNTAVGAYNTTTDITLTAAARNARGLPLRGTRVTTTVKAVSKTAKTTAASFLSIGDSLTLSSGGTANAVWQEQVQGSLTNMLSVGTRTFNNGVTNTEGRGGWLTTDYCRGSGDAARQAGLLDSPFMFPTGITGANYRGNTEDWKKIIAQTVPYDHNGFQKIAKNWTDATSGSFIYDATTGYPLTPQTNWVVYDSTKTAGQQFQQYNGSAWVAMGTQPTWELSISKYFERYAAAFATNGLPSVITIMLGTNNANRSFREGIGAINIPTHLVDPPLPGTSLGGTNALSEYLTDMAALITSIRAWSASVRIILCVPPKGASQDAATRDSGCGMTAVRFNQNIMEVFENLLRVYDTAAQETGNVFVCCPGLNVDPTDGYKKITENYNKYSASTITLDDDWFHPSVNGYKQMGDAIGAVIQFVRP
jgi:lysophospholipase L1-like esterase